MPRGGESHGKLNGPACNAAARLNMGCVVFHSDVYIPVFDTLECEIPFFKQESEELTSRIFPTTYCQKKKTTKNMAVTAKGGNRQGRLEN